MTIVPRAISYDLTVSLNEIGLRNPHDPLLERATTGGRVEGSSARSRSQEWDPTAGHNRVA